MIIKELRNEEFDKFVKEFKDGSIYQTSQYAMIMTKHNYESILLGMIDNDKIVAASLILIEKRQGFKYAYAPKGFLIDYNNKYHVEQFTKLIKSYLSSKKIMAIKVNPLIIKNSYEYSADNYSYNTNFESIFSYLKSLGYVHLGFNNLFEAFTPRFEGVINLNKTTSMLFYGLSKNFRSKVRSADKNGIRIIKGNIDDLIYLHEQTKDKIKQDLNYFKDVYSYFEKKDFVEFYYAKLDTNKYLMNAQKKYQNQSEICNKINNKIFKNRGKSNNKLINRKIIEENKLNELKNELIYTTNLLKDNPNGIVVSTMLITKFKDEVYVFMDGFDKTYKKLNAKHLMIWKLIEKYSKEKFKRFNLGGMINPKLKSNDFKGLNDFKFGFNAKCIEYVGDFELVANFALYNLYRNSKPIRYILKKDK